MARVERSSSSDIFRTRIHHFLKKIVVSSENNSVMTEPQPSSLYTPGIRLKDHGFLCLGTDGQTVDTAPAARQTQQNNTEGGQPATRPDTYLMFFPPSTKKQRGCSEEREKHLVCLICRLHHRRASSRIITETSLEQKGIGNNGQGTGRGRRGKQGGGGSAKDNTSNCPPYCWFISRSPPSLKFVCLQRRCLDTGQTSRRVRAGRHPRCPQVLVRCVSRRKY